MTLAHVREDDRMGSAGAYRATSCLKAFSRVDRVASTQKNSRVLI